MAIVLAGAAAICALAASSSRRRLRLAAAIAVALATTLLALVAIGLPARLLAPAHWRELGRGLRTGVDGAFGGDYPYIGGQWWIRITILCGLPLVLGASAALEFATTERSRVRRLALPILLGAWGTATALNAPADPMAIGVVLFAAVAAWLWLGRARRTAAVPAVVLLTAAALVAMPLAVALDRGRPVFDYRNWNFSFSSPASRSISYTWDHTYGPLTWPRTGHTLFTVSGTRPQYWRAATLDRFDGVRWLNSSDPGAARFELPAAAERATTVGSRIASLDPRWVHNATFAVNDLSSQLVVAPGAVLRWRGLPGATAAANEILLPPSSALGVGDTYSVLAYEPDPSRSDLRDAPGALPAGLRRYTEIGLPRITKIPVPTDRLGHAIQLGRGPSRSVSVRTVEMPLYGRSHQRTPGAASARRALAGSVYGPVFRLARRLTAGAGTQYGAVRAVEDYLHSARYTYSERPPRRDLPLRAFLLRDRRGYCQQFSGAMALMLRAVGIPARVASGFAPGIPNPHGNGFVVRDLDAHSWVEVYFAGIGWVPFDPTPAAAPASSQFARPAGLVTQGPSRQLANQPGGATSANLGLPVPAAGGSGTGPWPWIAAALGVLAAGLAALTLRRRARFLALSPAEAAAAQVRELGAIIRRLGLDRRRAVTLLELERRLEVIAGPPAGAYAGALRAARFGPAGAKPPTLRDRRRLRSALFSGSGLRRRLAGVAALPPGGPR